EVRAAGYGAAVDVQFFGIDAQFFDDREDLPGECLVDLDQIDVVEFQSCFFERDFRRRHRTDAHDVGIAAGNAPGDDPAQCSLALRVFSCSNRYHSGAVDDA